MSRIVNLKPITNRELLRFGGGVTVDLPTEVADAIRRIDFADSESLRWIGEQVVKVATADTPAKSQNVCSPGGDGWWWTCVVDETGTLLAKIRTREMSDADRAAMNRRPEGPKLQTEGAP